MPSRSAPTPAPGGLPPAGPRPQRTPPSNCTLVSWVSAASAAHVCRTRARQLRMLTGFPPLAPACTPWAPGQRWERQGHRTGGDSGRAQPGGWAEPAGGSGAGFGRAPRGNLRVRNCRNSGPGQRDPGWGEGVGPGGGGAEAGPGRLWRSSVAATAEGPLGSGWRPPIGRDPQSFGRRSSAGAHAGHHGAGARLQQAQSELRVRVLALGPPRGLGEEESRPRRPLRARARGPCGRSAPRLGPWFTPRLLRGRPRGLSVPEPEASLTGLRFCFCSDLVPLGLSLADGQTDT